MHFARLDSAFSLERDGNRLLSLFYRGGVFGRARGNFLSDWRFFSQFSLRFSVRRGILKKGRQDKSNERAKFLQFLTSRAADVFKRWKYSLY